MKESTGFALEVFQRFPLGIMIFQYVAPAELFLAKGNLEAGKLIGFGDRDCRGEEFDELWPNARSQGIIQACVNTVQTGEPFVADRVHFQGNGTCRAFKIHAFGLDHSRLCLTIEETEGGDTQSENVHPLDKVVYARR